MNPNKKNYQATFIIDHGGRAESIDQLIEELKGEIAAVEGDVGEIQNLGQREFARVTDPKFTSGVYVQVAFAAPATAPAALAERLRLKQSFYRTFVQSV